jgi:hypothetical protein
VGIAGSGNAREAGDLDHVIGGVSLGFFGACAFLGCTWESRGKT